MQNKDAFKRYKTIDTLLSSAEGADIYTLMESCGVSRPQIYSDLDDMAELFDVSYETFKRGRKTVYRYAKDSHRINGEQLSDSEFGNIRDALRILETVKGLPYVKSAIDALRKRIDESSDAPSESISFETSALLTNGDLVWDLYKYIREQNPLTFRYNTGFHEWHDYSIQPYYLKQYNGRWFLLAWEYAKDGEEMEELWLAGKRNQPRIYAIDRIDRTTLKKDISRATLGRLHSRCPVDLNSHFNDVIGVTVIQERPVDTIVMRLDKFIPDSKGCMIKNTDIDRIKSKKLHASQTVIEENEEFVRLQICVRENFELFTALCQYTHLEIESPTHIREHFIARIRAMAGNYEK